MLHITQLLILLCALSIDTFATSLAYSAQKIKIPKLSALLISFICSLVVALGIETSSAAIWFLPAKKLSGISAFILVVLGFLKSFEFRIKNRIKKNNKKYFRFLNFNFFIEIICDSTQADLDRSKELSVKEAYPLALALSLDGFAAGISAGLLGFSVGSTFILSFIFGVFAIALGTFSGKKLSQKNTSDLSWLSGIILLILGILKLKP